MKKEEMSLLNNLLHKDDMERFLKRRNNKYVLSKQKHENIFVFFKRNQVIVFDKRNKITNVYNNLKIAAEKLQI
jgi:hypothetical protein